jgi:hypothetical protein
MGYVYRVPKFCSPPMASSQVDRRGTYLSGSLFNESLTVAKLVGMALVVSGLIIGS